jgi:predicted kinase
MIILVFGLPGTGKSYFSRYLAADIHAKHLNADIVREQMNERGNYDEKTIERVYQQLLQKTEEEIKEGRDVVVDGTFHQKDRRDKLIDMARRNEERIFFVEMKAAEQTVKERLKRKREFSEADFQVYLDIKNSFDPFDDYHLEMWSDDEDLANMGIHAKKYIYEQGTNQPITDQL